MILINEQNLFSDRGYGYDQYYDRFYDRPGHRSGGYYDNFRPYDETYR